MSTDMLDGLPASMRWFILGVTGFVVVMLALTPIFLGGFQILTIKSMLMGDHREWKIKRNISNNGIEVNPDSRSLTYQFNKLYKLTARSGPVGQNIDVLHIVVVETDGSSENSSKFKNGYRVAALDLAELRDGALLLVADVPYLWEITNSKPHYIARLGFEGQAPFDVMNAPDGLIGGIRIGSFGARRTTTPTDFSKRSCLSHRIKFCRAVNAWRKHFTKNSTNVRIWHFVNPTKITPNSNFLSAVASHESRYRFASELCDRETIRLDTQSC